MESSFVSHSTEGRRDTEFRRRQKPSTVIHTKLLTSRDKSHLVVSILADKFGRYLVFRQRRAFDYFVANQTPATETIQPHTKQWKETFLTFAAHRQRAHVRCPRRCTCRCFERDPMVSMRRKERRGCYTYPVALRSKSATTAAKHSSSYTPPR